MNITLNITVTPEGAFVEGAPIRQEEDRSEHVAARTAELCKMLGVRGTDGMSIDGKLMCCITALDSPTRQEVENADYVGLVVVSPARRAGRGVQDD
jgi:hypothetical protein